MTYNLELVRDTYSRDMGTFGKLSVYHEKTVTLTPSFADLEGREIAHDDLKLRPGGIVEVSKGGIPTVTRDKVFECETVERPWANNTPNVSCIPQGRYKLEPRRFYRGGYETFEICNVEGRSLILVHRGNTPSDVEGCIAVGTGRGFVIGQWAVTDSKRAFERLMNEIMLTELGHIHILQYVPAFAEQALTYVDGA